MHSEKRDNFYRAFEEQFRGSREAIYERLQTYCPFLIAFSVTGSPRRALDLGCGRGEWLQLLQKQGFQASGVDLDQGMLAACHALGLEVRLADALATLRSTASQSLAVVSGFHIAEHLPFEHLHELMQEAHRVLQPGGIFILETPNPENFRVASLTFHLDPTHIKPIPPSLLIFMTEYWGFKRSKLLRLQEDPVKLKIETVTIEDVFSATSPDYAVIAQKDAAQELLNPFNSAFDAEYGLKPEMLYARFQTSLDKLREDIDKQACALQQLYQSRSWRLTAPLRYMNARLQGGLPAVRLAAKQTVKSVLYALFNHVLLLVSRYPKLKPLIWRCVALIPGMRAKLLPFIYRRNTMPMKRQRQARSHHLNQGECDQAPPVTLKARSIRSNLQCSSEDTLA